MTTSGWRDDSPMEPKGTVLVVDDSADIRVLLASRLEAEGYHVDVAEDGAKALAVARRRAPDVLISDWVMPVMDGQELCNKIRADPDLRGIFFVMLTAQDSRDARVKALLSGADDFLGKPWDEGELLARIRGGMRIIRLQHEVKLLDRRDILAKLAVTAGHEINNPLAGLMAELQVIQMEEQLSARGEEGINRAVDLARRIADIVARLQDLDLESVKDYAAGVQMFDLKNKG